MNLIIRRAILSDADFICENNCLMAVETEGRELKPDVVDAGVKNVFRNPQKGFYLVAERGGERLGSLMITLEWSDWSNANYWWFQSVYIRRQFRGEGVFRAMYNKVLEMAKTDGAAEVRLYVEKENENAQNTYKKLGMSESHYFMYSVKPG